MTPDATPIGPPDGVEAMLSILSALAGRRPVTCRDLETLTGLSSHRLCAYSAILQEDGLVIFESTRTMRLTNSGEAILREFGKPDTGCCKSSETEASSISHEPKCGRERP